MSDEEKLKRKDEASKNETSASRTPRVTPEPSDPFDTLIQFAQRGAQTDEDKRRLEEVLAEIKRLKEAVAKAGLPVARKIDVALPAGGEAAKEVNSPILESLQEQLAQVTSPLFHGLRQEALSRIDAENRDIRKEREKGFLRNALDATFHRGTVEAGSPQYKVVGRNGREAIWSTHIARRGKPEIAASKLKYKVRRSEGGFVELDSLQFLEEHLRPQDNPKSGSRADYTVEFDPDGVVGMTAVWNEGYSGFDLMSPAQTEHLSKLGIMRDIRIYDQFEGTTEGDGHLNNIFLKMSLRGQPSVMVGQKYKVAMRELNGQYVWDTIGSVFNRNYTTGFSFNIDENGKGEFLAAEEHIGTKHFILTRPLTSTLRFADNFRRRLQNIEPNDFVGLVGGVAGEIPHSRR